VNHEKPLWWRIHHNPAYRDICLAIGYRGVTYRELAELLETLGQKHDKRKLEAATVHLLTYEGQFTVSPKPLVEVKFRGEVRTLLWQLLGPPPKHPWHGKMGEGPHLPRSWDQPARPADKPMELPAATTDGGETDQEESAAKPGVSPEQYAAEAAGKNRRSLLTMLRNARRKFAHHGKRSFLGKEAVKEIAAVEAELRHRGLPIPPEGQETVEWDKKKE
jgi:hypothetical protein